ncbi:hypothetical protein MBLNU459_g7228t2 [Dothideomycetes sp. NU459]
MSTCTDDVMDEVGLADTTQASAPLPPNQTWNPSQPILFADKIRPMSRNLTWTRNSRIEFSSGQSSKRHVATKRTRTIEYKPPSRSGSAAEVHNPNDLSSLFGVKPKLKKPTLLSVSASASQSKPDRPKSNENLQARDQLVDVDDAIERNAFGRKPRQQAETSVDLTALDHARLQAEDTILDDEPKAAREQTRVTQEKAMDQEKERHEALKGHVRDKEELKRVRDQLDASRLENDRLRRESHDSLSSLNAEKQSLMAQLQTLEETLVSYKNPRTQQLKRMARSRDERANYQEEQRAITARNRRAAVRKSYESWREYFKVGADQGVSFLNGKSYSRAYSGLGKRELNYWVSAVRGFDKFTAKTREYDDQRVSETEFAAREKRTNERETEDPTQRQALRLDFRNEILEKLAVYLSSRLERASVAEKEYALSREEVVASFAELKLVSHDVRRFTKLVRINMIKDGTPPVVETRSMYEAVLQHQASTIVKRLSEKFEMDKKRVDTLRKTKLEQPQERLLKHQAEAIVAIQHTLDLLRAYLYRHNDLLMADWLANQPTRHQAMWEKTDEVLQVLSHERAKLAGITKAAPRYGLQLSHLAFSFGKLLDVRPLIEEYQMIVFRNGVINHHHGRVNSGEESRLQAIAKRRYEDTASRLRIVLRHFQHSGLQGRMRNIIRSVRTQRAAEDPANHRIDSAHPEAADLARDTEMRFTMRRKPVIATVRPSDDRTAQLQAEEKLLETSKDITTHRETDGNIGTTTEADDEAASMMEGTDAASVLEGAEIMKPDDALETYTPAEEGVVPTDAENRDDLADRSQHRTPPRWRAGRQASRSSIAQIQSSSPSTIRPRRGVFPKPEYKSKLVSRLKFRPTSARQSMHPIRLHDEPESSWFPDKGTSSPQLPDSGDHHSSVRLTLSSETEGAADVQPSSQKIEFGDECSHRPLRYQIPQEEFRNALLASKTSGAAFWKFSLYKSPNGEKPTVHYCRKYQGAEEAAKLFLNQSVLGFDIEWEMGARIGVNSIKENVSLIQIACEDRIALFQIATFQGEDELMPPSLKEILESPDITKVGVNIAGDFTRMRNCFGIQGQGLFELSHLYKVVRYSANEPTKVDKKPAKLSEQVENLLHLPLAKGEVRTSAWSKMLSAEQIEYAANDAYAGFRVYDALEAKRKAMDPRPPRPAFYELDKPLILGNGEPAPRAIRAKRKNVQAQVSDTTESALVMNGKPLVSEDVQEDDHEEEALSAPSDDEFYSCESDIADAEETCAIEQMGSKTTQQVGPSSIRSGARAAKVEQQVSTATASARVSNSSNPAPPELIRSEQWLAQWRAGLPPDRPMRVTPAYMRAYALWQSQRLELQQVAALLRQPPLALSSVASYVCLAVQQEGLPFDRKRLREALKYVPYSAQWRYRGIVRDLQKQ